MNRLFVDANVVLDILGERESFYTSAAKIVTLADAGRVQLVVSAMTYTTVRYVLSKFEGDDIAREKIRKFKVLVETTDLTDKIIDKGLFSGFRDFEDALQYHCALAANCNIIVTRNVKDFKKAEIPVITPDEYLRIGNMNPF